jgi:hypothetical protein
MRQDMNNYTALGSERSKLTAGTFIGCRYYLTHIHFIKSFFSPVKTFAAAGK